jgi:hypothetical protein
LFLGGQRYCVPEAIAYPMLAAPGIASLTRVAHLARLAREWKGNGLPTLPTGSQFLA